MTSRARSRPFRGPVYVRPAAVVTLAARTLLELRSPSESSRSEKRGLARASPSSAAPFTHAGLGLADTHSLATPCDATRTADPLLAFPSPTGFDPLDSPRASRRPAPLLGFGPLQRIRGAESTLLLPAGPIQPTTFRPQGSSPLDGLLLHPPCPSLSAGRRSWGSPFRGFPSRTDLSARRCQDPLLAFFPGSGPSLPRTERTKGAWSVSLETPPPHHFVAYRVFYRSRVRSVRVTG